MAIRTSPYSAMLDASVLYPAPLRDLLIQIATTGLYRAKWTNEIHEEWMNSVLRNRPDLTRAQLERTRDLMNASTMDGLVEGYQHLIAPLSLPDEHDRHVLAAAIHARCDTIITFNLKDFPARILERDNIEPIHPDEFIFNQLGLNQAKVIASAYHCRSRLKKPLISAERYLQILASQSLPKTVMALEPFRDVI